MTNHTPRGADRPGAAPFQKRGSGLAGRDNEKECSKSEAGAKGREKEHRGGGGRRTPKASSARQPESAAERPASAPAIAKEAADFSAPFLQRSTPHSAAPKLPSAAPRERREATGVRRDKALRGSGAISGPASTATAPPGGSRSTRGSPMPPAGDNFWVGMMSRSASEDPAPVKQREDTKASPHRGDASPRHQQPHARLQRVQDGSRSAASTPPPSVAQQPASVPQSAPVIVGTRLSPFQSGALAANPPSYVAADLGQPPVSPAPHSPSPGSSGIAPQQASIGRQTPHDSDHAHERTAERASTAEQHADAPPSAGRVSSGPRHHPTDAPQQRAHHSRSASRDSCDAHSPAAATSPQRWIDAIPKTDAGDAILGVLITMAKDPRLLDSTGADTTELLRLVVTNRDPAMIELGKELLSQYTGRYGRAALSPAEVSEIQKAWGIATAKQRGQGEEKEQRAVRLPEPVAEADRTAHLPPPCAPRVVVRRQDLDASGASGDGDTEHSGEEQQVDGRLANQLHSPLFQFTKLPQRHFASTQGTPQATTSPGERGGHHGTPLPHGLSEGSDAEQLARAAANPHPTALKSALKTRGSGRSAASAAQQRQKRRASLEVDAAVYSRSSPLQRSVARGHAVSRPRAGGVSCESPDDGALWPDPMGQWTGGDSTLPPKYHAKEPSAAGAPPHQPYIQPCLWWMNPPPHGAALVTPCHKCGQVHRRTHRHHRKRQSSGEGAALRTGEGGERKHAFVPSLQNIPKPDADGRAHSEVSGSKPHIGASPRSAFSDPQSRSAGRGSRGGGRSADGSSPCSCTDCSCSQSTSTRTSLTASSASTQYTPPWYPYFPMPFYTGYPPYMPVGAGGYYLQQQQYAWEQEAARGSGGRRRSSSRPTAPAPAPHDVAGQGQAGGQPALEDAISTVPGQSAAVP